MERKINKKFIKGLLNCWVNRLLLNSWIFDIFLMSKNKIYKLFNGKEYSVYGGIDVDSDNNEVKLYIFEGFSEEKAELAVFHEFGHLIINEYTDYVDDLVVKYNLPETVKKELIRREEMVANKIKSICVNYKKDMEKNK